MTTIKNVWHKMLPFTIIFGKNARLLSLILFWTFITYVAYKFIVTLLFSLLSTDESAGQPNPGTDMFGLLN